MFLSLLFLLTAPAAPIELDWQAPASCPVATEVRDRIRAQAESDEVLPILGVEARVQERSGGRWSIDLAIRLAGDLDRRTLEGETCEAVTDAAVLIVALRWVASTEDPSSPAAKMPEPTSTRQPLPEPTPPDSKRASPELDPPATVATPHAVAAPVTSEPSPDLADLSDRPALAGWVSTAGGLAFGVLPGMGGAFTVDGGIQGRRWRVGLSARGLPVRAQPPRAGSPVRGRFDLVTGGVLGCGLPVSGRWTFPLCGRVDVGGLRGTGQNAVDQARVAWKPWVGVAASAGAAWQARAWLAPFVAAEGVIGALRPGFSVGGVNGTFFAARRVGFRAWAGLEFRLKKTPQKR